MIKRLKNIPPSIWLLFALVIFFISYNEIRKGGKKDAFHVVKSDAQFYHEYIAVYIFGQEPYFSREKKPINKYTMGMAVSYLPAIATGYVICELTEQDHNHGKSYVYQHLLFYLGLLYTIVGLVFLRLILKKWFGEIAITIVLGLIFFGTNLYYYIIFEPIMAHPVSFALLTGFAYYSLQLIEKRTYRYALGVGITLGLLTLIRPTNIIVGIFPLVYFLLQYRGQGNIMTMLKKDFPKLLLILTISFLLFFPQMFYWHHYTGKWFTYSYGKEGFFWNKPAILQVLFSFRKGWLIYTPLMFFIIPGAVICFKKNKPLFWAITIYFLLNLYIISSWWCWWYGGSFGMRTLIDCYGLMAIFICFFIDYILKKKKVVVGIFLLIFIFLVYLNLYQTRQARICRIHFDSMTFMAYKKVFLTDRLTLTKEEWEAMLDSPDYDAAIQGKRFW